MGTWKLKFLSVDEQELVKALKDNKLKTRQIVGRGTLVVDANEVRKTKKFQDYADKASQIIGSQGMRATGG